MTDMSWIFAKATAFNTPVNEWIMVQAFHFIVVAHVLTKRRLLWKASAAAARDF